MRLFIRRPADSLISPRATYKTQKNGCDHERRAPLTSLGALLTYSTYSRKVYERAHVLALADRSLHVVDQRGPSTVHKNPFTIEYFTWNEKQKHWRLLLGAEGQLTRDLSCSLPMNDIVLYAGSACPHVWRPPHHAVVMMKNF